MLLFYCDFVLLDFASMHTSDALDVRSVHHRLNLFIFNRNRTFINKFFPGNLHFFIYIYLIRLPEQADQLSNADSSRSSVGDKNVDVDSQSSCKLRLSDE